jgi:hypothetical protein
VSGEQIILKPITKIYAAIVLSRAKNSGRQLSFQNLVRWSQIKKKSLPDYAHVNKVSKK